MDGILAVLLRVGMRAPVIITVREGDVLGWLVRRVLNVVGVNDVRNFLFFSLYVTCLRRHYIHKTLAIDVAFKQRSSRKSIPLVSIRVLLRLI